MLNSQTSILEKLQSLSLEKDIETFIIDIMNFYKNHIIRLQKIIIQKQEQIDNIFSLKNNYEKKIESFKIEFLQSKINEEKLIEENYLLKKENNNFFKIVENLKGDLKNSIFEKNVKEDDLKNFYLKLNMLEKQNNLLMEQNIVLENKLKNKNNNNRDEKNESTMLIKEIKELKFQLRNNNERNFSPEKIKNYINKSVFLDKKDLEIFENKKNFNSSFNNNLKNSSYRDFQNDTDLNDFENFKREKKKENKYDLKKLDNFDLKKNDHFSSKNKKEEEEKNISPETKEVNIGELKNYLGFLQQKEKDIQNNLWKLPSKCRNKVEKDNKRSLEKELDEVNDEIISIKNLIRNNK